MGADPTPRLAVSLLLFAASDVLFAAEWRPLGFVVRMGGWAVLAAATIQMMMGDS